MTPTTDSKTFARRSQFARGFFLDAFADHDRRDTLRLIPGELLRFLDTKSRDQARDFKQPCGAPEALSEEMPQTAQRRARALHQLRRLYRTASGLGPRTAFLALRMLDESVGIPQTLRLDVRQALVKRRGAATPVLSRADRQLIASAAGCTRPPGILGMLPGSRRAKARAFVRQVLHLSRYSWSNERVLSDWDYGW